MADTIEARPGLRAPCLKDPKAVWSACLHYTSGATRKGEDAARRWAKGIWHGIYPGADMPFGWFNAPIPSVVDQNALALAEREVKRFRKNKRRAA